MDKVSMSQRISFSRYAWQSNAWQGEKEETSKILKLEYLENEISFLVQIKKIIVFKGLLFGKK